MTAVPLTMEPDPTDPELWQPYIDGTVDGRPHRFLLDTGAGTTRLLTDPAIAELPVVGTKQSNAVFGTLTDDLVTVKSLEVGPIAMTDLTVVRTSTDDRPSLVGMDALGGMAMVLDFDRARVDFVPSGSLPTGSPMRRSPNGQPFLELEFPDATALTCFDTGSSITLVNAAFHAAHGELFTPIGSSEGTDSAGNVQETEMYQMAACAVGGITLASQRVAVVPLPQNPMPMDMVLGYPAIRQYVWTLDYPISQWSATPSATPSAIPSAS